MSNLFWLLGSSITKPLKEYFMAKICNYPKGVHVNHYKRFRYGKWEFVCEHCRSYPNQQLVFNF